ncbi:MAG: RagB/SusD family nutrient uptake outer membrane protein, partial [Alistipes sp.]|nr:RagB/SusD family nutrient uptake outer membrane protein [Alistipes sp.]
MRVAEVYLMYAEACAAAGGASYKASSCTHTAASQH